MILVLKELKTLEKWHKTIALSILQQKIRAISCCSYFLYYNYLSCPVSFGIGNK